MAKQPQKFVLEVEAPKFQTLTFKIEGTQPYVQNRMSAKARAMMRAKQMAGDTASSTRKKREPKDFHACYEDAMHRFPDGTWGIPSTAIKSAMVSACRLCGVEMTRAKLCLYVGQDGYDRIDGVGLVRITKGKPHMVEHTVRNDSGVCDLRARPMFDPGWQAEVPITFDAGILTAESVANLLVRAGAQVGVGEGRNDSKESKAGMGWGSFKVMTNVKTKRTGGADVATGTEDHTEAASRTAAANGRGRVRTRSADRVARPVHLG